MIRISLDADSNKNIILDIVKADADFADVLGWIGCRPEANQWVHLAHEAFFSIVRQSEPHLAVPHPCFEVVEQEQGLPIYVDVDAAVTLAIGSGGDLHALQQVMELCRPFNDGVLTQWHRCAGVGMILQGFNTLSEGHASRFQKGGFREIMDGCLMRTEVDPQLHNNGK
jgi:hypothetical protein